MTHAISNAANPDRPIRRARPASFSGNLKIGSAVASPSRRNRWRMNAPWASPRSAGPNNPQNMKSADTRNQPRITGPPSDLAGFPLTLEFPVTGGFPLTLEFPVTGVFPVRLYRKAESDNRIRPRILHVVTAGRWDNPDMRWLKS